MLGGILLLLLLLLNWVIYVSIHPDAWHMVNHNSSQQWNIYGIITNQIIFSHPCTLYRKFMSFKSHI